MSKQVVYKARKAKKKFSVKKGLSDPSELMRFNSQLDELIEFQWTPELLAKFGRYLTSGTEAVGEGITTAGTRVRGFFTPRPGVNPAVVGPRVMMGGVATGGAAGTDPLGRFVASRAAANPAIARTLGGPGGMATGAPVSVPTKIAAAAASPEIAKKVANQAGQLSAAERAQQLLRTGASRLGGATLGIGAGSLLQINQQRKEQQMNARDKLIQFRILPTIPPGARHPLPVLESSWRKWKRPSPRTLGNIMRRTERATGKNPTIAFRPKATWLITKLDDIINFQDTRPRSPVTGEFTGQQGGPDPNAMATVYKMPQMQPTGPGVGAAAGTLLAGGALGAVGANVGKLGYDESVKLIKHLAAKRKSFKLKI